MRERESERDVYNTRYNTERSGSPSGAQYRHFCTSKRIQRGAQAPRGASSPQSASSPHAFFLVEFQHMPLNKTPPSSSPACTHTCNADPSEPGAGVSVTLTAPLLGGRWTCMSLSSCAAAAADCMSAREIYDAQQQKTEKQKRASGAGELLCRIAVEGSAASRVGSSS